MRARGRQYQTKEVRYDPHLMRMVYVDDQGEDQVVDLSALLVPIKRSTATAGASTSDATTGITTGLAFELSRGMWLISIALIMTSAVNTTAPQFSLVATDSLTASDTALLATVPSSDTASQDSNVTGLASWTPGTNGPGSTERLVTIDALVRVSVAGTLTLWMRSEVGSSAVSIVRGGGTATKVR